MWGLIEAIWLAAGAVAVAGTLWLAVASKLGIWPFRRHPAVLVEKVYGFDGSKEYSRFMLAYTTADGMPDQWFEGNE